MSFESALRILRLDSPHFSEKDLREKLKKSLLNSDISLSDICESSLILYKRLPSLIAGTVWQEIFGECMKSAQYSPEQLELTINGFDSIVHHMLFKEMQLKFKADCVILRNTMKLKVTDITVPYDRSRKSFGDIMIIGQSLSRRVLSLVIEGSGAMVFIAFYFQNLLMDFWNKLKSSDVKDFYLPRESLVSQENDFKVKVTTSETSSQKSSLESLLSSGTSFSPMEEEDDPVLTPPEYSDSDSLHSQTKSLAQSSNPQDENASLPSPGRDYSLLLSSPEKENKNVDITDDDNPDDSNDGSNIGDEEDGNQSPIIVSTKKRLEDFAQPVSTELAAWVLSGFVHTVFYSHLISYF